MIAAFQIAASVLTYPVRPLPTQLQARLAIQSGQGDGLVPAVRLRTREPFVNHPDHLKVATDYRTDIEWASDRGRRVLEDVAGSAEGYVPSRSARSRPLGGGVLWGWLEFETAYRRADPDRLARSDARFHAGGRPVVGGDRSASLSMVLRRRLRRRDRDRIGGRDGVVAPDRATGAQPGPARVDVRRRSFLRNAHRSLVHRDVTPLETITVTSDPPGDR